MLTRLPGERPPSAVRRNVSSITSAVTLSRTTSAAVRHTPLTATESPTAVPARSGSAMVSRAESDRTSTSVTVARLSTMPVNISTPLSVEDGVDPYIRADPRHRGDVQPHGLADRRHTGRVEHRGPGTQQRRRVVADDAVHEPVAHERPGQRCAALQEQHHRVALEELGEQRGQVESAVAAR